MSRAPLKNSLLREDILTDIKRALDASNETYRNLKQMFELADTNDISIVFAPVSPDRPNARNAALPEAREVVGVFNENAEESPFTFGPITIRSSLVTTKVCVIL